MSIAAAGAGRAAGKLRASFAGAFAMAQSPSQALPANAQQRYDVRRADLPLSCPTPAMALWNSHPRVYLPIAQEGGEAQCPYCGAHFVLVD